MISTGKIILVVSVVAVTLGIYYFGDFKGPEKTEPVVTAEEATGNFDFGLYKETVFAGLEAAERQKIEKLEKELAGATADSQKLVLLNDLIMVYEQQNAQVVASVYSEEQARIIGTSAAWEKTGDNYVSVLYAMTQLPPDVTGFVVKSAQSSYQQAIALDEGNANARISLATTYLETPDDGTNPAMQGVKLLLDVVREDSANVRAQLILGRYGIISGQFDKAVQRLETVVSLDPQNTEALFFLGEAYNGLGNKAKAIENFEKCKRMVNDPEFSAQLDAYIAKLTN